MNFSLICGTRSCYKIEWYDDEYKTYDECLQFTYTRTHSSSPRITFDSKLFLQDSRNYNAVQTYNGVGEVFYPGGIGIDSVEPTRANHQVLATDYTHYAFVWDCFNVNGTHYNERMWYFDRQPNPPCRPAEVENLICRYFDERYIRKTYHGLKCKY